MFSSFNTYIFCVLLYSNIKKLGRKNTIKNNTIELTILFILISVNIKIINDSTYFINKYLAKFK